VRFPIDQLSETTDLYPLLPSTSSLLLSVFCPQELFFSDDMAPAKPIELGEYRPILITHAQEYRDSKGTDRDEIVAEIMKEIVAQNGGNAQKDVLKGLDTVSHQIQPHNPGISLDWA
jgi:hypothetical protein